MKTDIQKVLGRGGYRTQDTLMTTSIDMTGTRCLVRNFTNFPVAPMITTSKRKKIKAKQRNPRARDTRNGKNKERFKHQYR